MNELGALLGIRVDRALKSAMRPRIAARILSQLPKPEGLGLVPGATSPADIRDVWRIDGRPTGNVASRDHICQASEPA